MLNQHIDIFCRQWNRTAYTQLKDGAAISGTGIGMPADLGKKLICKFIFMNETYSLTLYMNKK